MFGSFMLGFMGGLVRFGGVIALLLALLAFALHGPAAPLYLVGGIGLIVGGSYMRYLSAHSVQISDHAPKTADEN